MRSSGLTAVQDDNDMQFSPESVPRLSNPFTQPATNEGTQFDLTNPRIGHSRFQPHLQRRPSISTKCFLCGQRYTLTCLLALLPTKSRCSVLCNSFFVTVFPLIAVLHLPSFIAEYDEFWDDFESRERHSSNPGPLLRRNPSFVCLLFSILYAGASSMPDLLNPESEDQDIAPGDLYFASVLSAAFVGFPRRPSLYSLCAYLFTQSQLSREEEFADAPSYVNKAFRVALGMGLHRDGSRLGLGPAESEVRRRLWHHVIHLDVLGAATSGLAPLFIDEKMASTTAISVETETASEGLEGELSAARILEEALLTL